MLITSLFFDALSFQHFRSDMGRLQRKKTSGAKKKKKSKVGPEPSVMGQAAVATSGIKTDSTAAQSKETPVAKAKTEKKQSRTNSVAATKPKTNFVQTSIQFLREVKIELKKVTWPSRKQTIGSTAVVIILVLIISLFLGFVDIGLSSLIRVVLK
jgi:preprotein translocase subunit SecE